MKLDVGVWIKEHLLNPENLPYSFVYGGRKIDRQEKGWSFESKSRELDGCRGEHVTKLSDPATGLVVTCVAVQNHKYPTVEWTLWFENSGSADTPVVSEVRAVDADLLPPSPDTAKNRFYPAVKLYHFMGDYCSPNGYEPLEHFFYYDVPLTLRSQGGRPTNVGFPYFRAQGEDGGAIIVVSWQGQWEATFAAVGNGIHQKDGLRVTAKQQFLHTKLLPGEKLRSPMIVFMPYDGTDGVQAQNLWRKWFIEFNMPKVDGELIKPFYANYGGGIFNEMVRANEENQKQYADLFFDNGVAFDYLWMDAGWYDTNGVENWEVVGTWKTDRRRFPNGIRAISDHVHQRGVKTILWFEPERVAPHTELADEHPQWLLASKRPDAGNDMRDLKQLDLGNDEAREWLTARVNSLIKSEGVDLYRQDFNTDHPLDFWRNGEPTDRQGVRENRHCVGYLKFWDDILAANPGIILDSCASGGRRNDLETMRRSLPLHKTDYNYADLTTKQGMHHTLFQWLPFFGSMNKPGDQRDIYYHRSSLLLSYHGCENVFKPGFDFKKLAAWMQEWRETAHCLYGDYYPLTPYSRDDRQWIAWQFHLPDADEGVIQVFMRPESPFVHGFFPLCAVDAGAVYELKDYNSGLVRQAKGSELLERGVEVSMSKRPDSALFHYRRAN